MFYKQRASISWTFVLLWMLFIFYLSSQNGVQSNELSKNVTRFLIQRWNLTICLPPTNLSFLSDSNMNDIVRSFGHLLLYFVLGFFVTNAFYHSKIYTISAMFYSFLICLVFAFSDEFHQSFVPGRGAELFDIYIDSIGSFIGIIFSFILNEICRLIRNKFTKNYSIN